jgi:hypothetical protein
MLLDLAFSVKDERIHVILHLSGELGGIEETLAHVVMPNELHAQVSGEFESSLARIDHAQVHAQGFVKAVLAFDKLLRVHHQIYVEIVADESPAVSAVIAAFKFAAGSVGFPTYRGQILFLGLAGACRQNKAEGQCKVSLREADV